MNTKTVLTDEKINEAWRHNSTGTLISGDPIKAFARAIEQAALQSSEVQDMRKDKERMRGALKKIADMDSMSYHSLESAKIVAKAAMEDQT